MKIRKEEWRSQGHRRSEGHRVCARGEVIRTHFENVGKQPNIVCRVESFCVAVQKFDDDRRQLVRRMGFEGLLCLDMKNIPRQFCYWLMTRVGAHGTVVFGDGVMLPLGAKQVRYILGIPMGANLVPTHVDMECEEEFQNVNRIIDLYGVGSKKETISLAAASRVMCPLDDSGEIFPLGDDEQDQEDFMTAFMVVVLGKLICTTTNSSNMARALVPVVTVASRAIDFDWCSFTLAWLCDTAARF
ncbi:uncharacterized protein LOC110689546 [Chenopodium quinoa]|uniref:uncharacterized protein LOC110689546 n=1 Tax=Chenopodium quinoa TaxID=63459 RepID=UPI000B77F636|nr:uncharacterized protein LOC110689546 [Chenopodium quinoa]XP_021722016.1 uncharacterized protein LOC110689546 [Chenopodium quinoa]